MNMISPNDPWTALWSLGYRRLIPIIPPGAPVTATCAVGKKLAKGGKDTRGKVPGIRLASGEWTNIKDWETLEPTPADLARWQYMGAGVGIRCSNGIVAVDADCLDPEHAAIVRQEVEKRIGVTPVRIGRDPKALYLCRSEDDASLAYASVHYGSGDERVEILSAQFVAAGTHQSGVPYRWTGLCAFEELPVVSVKTLSELMDALERLLPKGEKHSELSTLTPVDQKLLVGSVDIVREAVRRTPNRIERRSDYVKYGYALRGALPFHEAEAHEMWLDFGSRWEGGENDVETLETEWSSFKGEQRLGANYLYAAAFKATGGDFNGKGLELARRFHEYVSEPPTSDFAVFSAASLAGLEVPKQRWLVQDLIPARNVTMLSGDGGTGKSLVTLQLGAAVATGTEWLGIPVERGRCLFLTAEDEKEELHRRLAAIARTSNRFTLEDLTDLHCVSLNGKDAVMAAPSGKEGLLKATEVFGRVKAAIERYKPTLTVLDTQADLFGGDENKRIHARQFIGMLQGLVNEFDTTIVLLSHPSMSGLNSGSGTSGNTAWNNSVRSRIYMERQFGKNEEEEDIDIRILTTKKANRSRAGMRFILRYANGRFIREGLEATSKSADQERSVELTFLRILADIIKSGRTASHLATAPTYAPRVMEKHHDANGVSESRFTDAMERLFSRGEIEVETVGPQSRRRSRIVVTKRMLENEDLFG